MVTKHAGTALVTKEVTPMARLINFDWMPAIIGKVREI